MRTRFIVAMTIASVALAISPTGIANAAPASAAAPRLKATSGCEGDPQTVVPDRAAVAKEGAAALFQPADLAADPTLPDKIPQSVKDMLANDPTWSTNLECGAVIPHDGAPDGVSVPAGQSRAAASSVTTYSNNWSGYVLDGVDADHAYYDTVSSAWSVPSPPAATHGVNQLSASQWVGIGSGDTINGTADSLLQAGTVSYSGPGAVGVGPIGTYGFYQVYPYQDEQIISNFAVNGGDAAGAWVIFEAATNSMMWGLCSGTANHCTEATLRLTDADVSSMAQQAEVIMERHGFNGGTSMLEPFGTVSYVENTIGEKQGNGIYDDSYKLGSTPTGGSAVLRRYVMTQCDGGTPYLDSVSGLNSGGDFSLTFKDEGTTC